MIRLIRRIRRYFFNRKLRAAGRLLKRLDKVMVKRNWPRWRKKQFWSSIIKDDEIRTEALDALMER